MTIAALPADRLNIHQVTLMQCDFRDSIECLSRGGVTQTAIWRDKLAGIDIADAVRILDDLGVSVSSLCAGGFLTGSSTAEKKHALDTNRQALDAAAELGAMSMVTITGGLADGDTDIDAARARALDALSKLVPIARSAGVRLALEPLHPMVCGFRSVITTLAEANDMLDTLDAPDVMGIALDSYALWWDTRLSDEIRRAGERIINFHVSDWLPETRDVRLDRGMPGDGHIDNRRIRGWLEASGFDGAIEVEIFSEADWWQRDPDQVVATTVERAARYL